MPAVSKAQRRLMGAAEHGADFPMAKKVRESMTSEQMHDFAATKEKGKPEHKEHHGRHKSSEHAPFGRKPNSRGGY
jgi:hypothetical protein